MEDKPISQKQQYENLVYEKRIRSYTELVWKINMAHNVHVDLSLKQDSFAKIFKYKAFVGFGNNSSMIKGLLRRRFWWTLV
jgi:hypothetical protein